MSILLDRTIPTTAEPKTEVFLCRKCGADVPQEKIASTSPEGKHTCVDCLTASVANEVTVLPAVALADAVERNSKNPVPTATPAPINRPARKAPAKATAPAVAAKPAMQSAKTPAAKAAPAEPLTEKQIEAQKTWDAVVALLDAGEGRTQIAQKVGVPYSTVARIIWFRKYGVNAMPGMASFDPAKMAAAQQQYLKDVAANKAAKAEEKAPKAEEKAAAATTTKTAAAKKQAAK